MTKNPAGGLFVLFGASGDLAQRMIIPALHQLYQRGKLGEDFAIIGAARTEMTDEEFQDFVRQSVEKGTNFESFEKSFFDHCRYQAADNTKVEDFEKLATKIKGVAKEFSIKNDFVYFYSIAPSLFDETTMNLKESGITDIVDNQRVLVEKPFGDSLDTSKEYHDLLTRVFEEDQIYYVDHFSGMDFVQNILATRYFNPFIEGVWNHDYIENIQISLPENLSIGTRGSFYDENGAIKDMFQNHVLQILATVATDLPDELTKDDIQTNKLEALKKIPTFTKDQVENQVVRGQYSGDSEGDFNSYRHEADVPSDSVTETYFAAELYLDTPRWDGVPFYVRTGKSLLEDFFAVDIILKAPKDAPQDIPNRISFGIVPAYGVSLVLSQKEPGAEYEPTTTFIGPDHSTFDDYYIPDPYENLLHDALIGEPLHFATYPQIKEQWRITDSITDAWAEMPEPNFPNYRANSFGPFEADQLLAKNNHEWIRRV